MARSKLGKCVPIGIQLFDFYSAYLPMSKLLCFLILIIFASAGFAQTADGEFIHTPRTTPGCNGLVTSSAKMLNGDVIFGGNFSRCGNVRANRVVRFDGTNFFSLGVGPDNGVSGVSGVVRAVFADGNKIYVGGYFKFAGQVSANNVAVFDGMAWHSIGRGSSNGVSGFVRSLQTFQGKLYVGGYYAVSANSWRALLREWNGASWRDVASFVDGSSGSSSVNAFATRDSKLYFGGTFDLVDTGYRNIGTFDGASIIYESFPGQGQSFNRIRDLHFFQGALCVAGSFLFPSQFGGGGGVACKDDGQWRSFPYGSMRALEDNGTTLFAAGFPQAGGGRVVALGTGEVLTPELGGADFVLTLVSQNGKLLIGGMLAQRTTNAQGLLKLNSGMIEPLIAGAMPNLIAPMDLSATADGRVFGYANSSGAFSKPNEYKTLVIREGITWHHVASPVAEFEVDFLLTIDNKLFLISGALQSIFERVGMEWLQISNSARVNAVYGSSLVLVPESASDSGNRVIQRLNGAILEPWLEIPILRRNGQDISRNESLPLSLTEFQGRPVIAGQFDEIVGVGPVGGVATYYEGAWHALGGLGLRDPKWVQTNQSRPQIMLQVWGGDLYASNGFTEADGQPVDGIARFDGSNWHAVGGGIVQSDNVAARAFVQMIVYRDKLYAYGAFDQAGGRAANGVAQWDGVTWRVLGGANGFEINSNPNKAVVANGDLLFSGEIHEAGGEPEDYFAIWRGNDMIFRSGFE